MSTMVLNRTNGSKPHASPAWKQQSVQQFFTAFNWDDHPPEIQELKLTVAQQPSNQALSMTLKVSQFFAAVNWDGNAIAATPTYGDIPPETPANDGLTLEDFSDLF
jgi:hypothetical protein